MVLFVLAADVPLGTSWLNCPLHATLVGCMPQYARALIHPVALHNCSPCRLAVVVCAPFVCAPAERLHLLCMQAAYTKMTSLT